MTASNVNLRGKKRLNSYDKLITGFFNRFASRYVPILTESSDQSAD